MSAPKTTHYRKVGHLDRCVSERDGAVCGRTRSEHNLTTAACPWHAEPSKPGPVRVPPSAATLGRGVLEDGDQKVPGNTLLVDAEKRDGKRTIAEPEAALGHRPKKDA